MELEGQYFEISIVYDIPIDENDFLIPQITNSQFINGSQWFFITHKSDGFYLLYLSLNLKNFFSRRNLFKEINEFGCLIDSIFNIKHFLYGVANFETNSFFLSEPYSAKPSKYAIQKSAFIFYNNNIEMKQNMNMYHIIFEYPNVTLLYNPIGQVLWPVTHEEIANTIKIL
jgi:hypothetical protein